MNLKNKKFFSGVLILLG